MVQLEDAHGWQKSCRFLFIILLVMSSANLNAQSNFNKKVNSLLNGSVPQIKTEELYAKMAKQEDIVLLDTRSKEEYAISKIVGAQFIDYDDFEKEMVEHIPKDQEIVVYCSVGYRSEKIGEKLREMGYTNVLNLYGGIFDWKNKDNEVIGSKNQKTDSVHTYNKNWSKWLNKGIKVYD